MNLDEIRNLIPDYAKDLKLNLSQVLSVEGAPGLGEKQIAATALASAIAARYPALIRQVEAAVADVLDDADLRAARAAAAIMGMNNIYYRFTHLVGNTDYAQLPARLRMNAIGQPGVDKTDFELYALAVSAINGCGACMAAHDKVVRNGGISAEGVQSAVRIAAVIHGIAVALDGEPQSDAQRAAA